MGRRPGQLAVRQTLPSLWVRLPDSTQPTFRQRHRLKATIERLIDLLDRFDAPAADLEDGDEDCCRAGDDRIQGDPAANYPHTEGDDEAEASLGWTVDGNNAAAFTRQDCDCESDRAEDEPSDGNDSGGDKLTTAWPECSL